MAPQVIFGAASIGDTDAGFVYSWTTPEQVSSLLEKLKTLGITRLDSAAVYPPTNAWNTELLLGQSKAAEKGFEIDSKIYYKDGPGHLGDKNVDVSSAKTLRLLGVDKINVLHNHFPDPGTSIADTAAAFDKQYRAGRFEKLGISNLSAAQVDEWCRVAKENDYVVPSVYQGNYSALYRHPENELFAVLRKHKMNFNAYSPTAGGFLTGKVTFGQDLTRTRWVGESTFGIYVQMFDHPEVHEAVKRLAVACEKQGISMVDASLRWVIYHSQLGDGDGIIIGGSKIPQIESNINGINGGPLPDELRVAVDSMWDEVKEAVPKLL